MYNRLCIRTLFQYGEIGFLSIKKCWSRTLPLRILGVTDTKSRAGDAGRRISGALRKLAVKRR